MFLILILTLTEGEDFISITDSLIFNPGMTQSCFEILITNDANPESSEAFTIDLSFNQLPDAPVIPPVSIMVTIIDTDQGIPVVICCPNFLIKRFNYRVLSCLL